MQVGDFIRHVRHRDIGYRIIDVTKIKGATFIEFEYWNLFGMSKPYRMLPHVESLFLKDEELVYWKVVKPQDLDLT